MQEVLIVWGEHDQLFPVDKAYSIQRYSYKCVNHLLHGPFFYRVWYAKFVLVTH